MEDDLDLDINNYNYQDLLALFKLSADFSEKQLSDAKKIVLKLHPDKSGLDSKYFIFYSSAYKQLFQIWKFRSNSEKASSKENTVYIADDNNHEDVEGQRNLLKKLFSEKKELAKADKFNEWFNSEFEKVKIHTEEETTGYKEWLRSTEEGEEPRQMSMSQMTTEFAKKRREMTKDIVVHQGVEGFDVGGGLDIGSSLGREGGNYDCVSNTLGYQDLMKAHTETLIQVDENAQTNKFSSVEEMREYRGQQEISPLSVAESTNMLEKQEKDSSVMASERAYRLMKESEEAKKKTEMFWKNLRLLN
tara:strand:- start:10053 stop:10964 length:912 start_codon:yes stop_codon:yes gene_type:complete